MLIVRRTLSPLLDERRAAFETEASRLASDPRPKKERHADLAQLDVATALLSLKICDPAMGSGHFLVSLVDYLADAMLAAIEDAPTHVDWTDANAPYVSPLVDDLAALRARILAKAAANGWRITTDQLDDRHLIRRLILKRCVYGVDKNPMAVELAKLSLWLHSFTVGAPLSFLDHHLRCGDSLFGEWVRPAIDRLAKGGMLVSATVQAAFGSAAAMARIEEISDVDKEEAAESKANFQTVQEATRPLSRLLDQLHGFRWIEGDAEDARKEMKRLRKSAKAALVAEGEKAAEALLEAAKPFERKAAALELWLEGTYGDPLPALDSFYGSVSAPDPALSLMGSAAAIAAEERFLHWEVAFPGVWTDPTAAESQGGFDALIGNPPWDRLKMQEVEWFAARKPAVAYEPRASDRKIRIQQLKDDGDPLWDSYVAVCDRAKQAARMTKLKPDKGGDYPMLGGGDVNLYSLFVERAQRLVKPGGIVGLLVPSGIAADKGAADFFKSVSTTGRLGSLLDFENRLGAGDGFFPDVDSRFKFAAFVTGGRGRTFAQAETGFFLGATDDAALARRTFKLAPDVFAKVNPNTGTAPVFRTADDARIVSDIYSRIPILVDRRTDPPTQFWPVKYSTMLHMANDADKFYKREELEADGWYRLPGGGMANGNRRALPLYVGRMFRQFDHRAANVRVNLENLHNPAVSDPTNDADKADPDFVLTPQFYVQEQEIGTPPAWSLAFRDIARVTDERTIIASIVPAAGFGNTAPLLLNLDAPAAALMVANLNSFALDFVARRKIQSTHANWYIVEQFPILPPAIFDRKFGTMTAGALIQREVLHLTYVSNDMASFASELGQTSAPFSWSPIDRRHRRARLDAAFMLLYGLSRADADYILDSFTQFREADIVTNGRYLTKALVLAYMNALGAGDVNVIVAP